MNFGRVAHLNWTTASNLFQYDHDYILVYLGLVPKTDAYFLKIKFSIKDFFSKFGHIYWKNSWWKTLFFVQWFLTFSVILKFDKLDFHYSLASLEKCHSSIKFKLCFNSLYNSTKCQLILYYPWYKDLAVLIRDGFLRYCYLIICH